MVKNRLSVKIMTLIILGILLLIVMAIVFNVGKVRFTGNVISENNLNINQKEEISNSEKDSEIGLTSDETILLNPNVKSMLKISDIDVDYGDDSENNLKEGDTIKKVRPGDTIDFNIEVKNDYDKNEGIEIKDIYVIVTIKNIDDDEDIEEDSSSFDLDAGKDKIVDISLDIPIESDEDNFDVIIEVNGKNRETNEDYNQILTLDLSVEKEDHEIKIIKTNLDPNIVKCERETNIKVTILNVGSKKEDNAKIAISNQDLGVNIQLTNIKLDNKAFDKDSQYKLTETISVSNDQKPGVYLLKINSFHDNDRNSDEANLDLIVEKCNEEIDEEFTIIDDIGREVTIKKYPQKIVSLAPSITEILYAIDLDDEIIGVDDFSDYPEEVNEKTRIGSYTTINLEILLSLDPDLIIASDSTSVDDIVLLENNGFTVVVLAPENILEIIENIRLVGLIGNKVSESDQLAENLEERIDTISSKINNGNVNKPKVYMEFFPYWTFGPDSYGNDLIVMAGGENVASSTIGSYSQITNEFVVASDPEYIIYTKGAYTQTTIEEIKARTGWSDTKAVKSNNIHTIDDNIVSRPGPRIVDALEKLTEIIHPELFS